MFEKPFRMHPFCIVENIFNVAAIEVIITCFVGQLLGFLSISITSQMIKLTTIILIAIPFISIWFIWRRWNRTFLSIKDGVLIYERKLMFQEQTTIGLKNISTVNMEQSFIERIVGICQVKIDTNSTTTANITDIQIILKKETGKLLCDYLNELIAGSVSPNAIPISEQEAFEFSYNFQDILTHTLLNISVLQIMIAIPIVILFIVVFAVDSQSILEDISNHLLTVILGTLIIVVTFFANLLRPFFQHYGFKCSRRGNNIELVYGYFNKEKYVLPAKKITAIEIQQPFLARLFKKYYIEVITIGVGNESDESSMLLLSDSRERLEEKLQVLLPEIPLSFDYQKQPKRIWIQMGLNIIFKMAILAFIAQITLEIGWLTIFLFPLFILSSIFNYFAKGLWIEDEQMYIRTGIFHVTTSIITYEKIQKIQIRNNILTKRLGLCQIDISIRGTILNQNRSTGYFSTDCAEKIIQFMMNAR